MYKVYYLTQSDVMQVPVLLQSPHRSLMYNRLPVGMHGPDGLSWHLTELLQALYFPQLSVQLHSPA